VPTSESALVSTSDVVVEVEASAVGDVPAGTNYYQSNPVEAVNC